jgi:hypothetical protein
MTDLTQGGKFVKQTLDSMAIFSDDLKYRYFLRRSWEPDKREVLFIMLNPSTADAFKFDPTVKRCFDFAHAWGYGGMTVCNLYAFRSTNPKNLQKEKDPVGKDNDEWLLWAGSYASLIVAAWGTHGTYLNQNEHVISIITKTLLKPLYYLEKTKDGHPAHPLYLKAKSQPTLFRADVTMQERLDDD